MVVPVILIGIGVFYAYVKLKMVNSMLGLMLAHSALRDQVDPTIAAISTLIVALTSLLLVFTQLVGKPSRD